MANTRKSDISSELILDGVGARHQQIERAIRDKIQTGAWPPGYRIPPEEELALMLGVSRAPLNKVLNHLANTKIIVRRRRLGTFVSERTDNHTVIGILDIREKIESTNKTYSFELLKREIVDGAEAYGWKEAVANERLLKLDLVHRANGASEVFEERFIRISVIPEVEFETFDKVLPNEWLLARLPCTRLINTIRATNADRRIAKALCLAPHEPLLVSERRTWVNADALTWAKLSFPAHRNEFVGEFSPLEPLATLR
ncbi:GntR family transcriptional regulator [Mesorhizobium sp. BAC0120]|uniref:GntR family transcriptional regulator n=1 Tax=Mesorhizobium sp. BAC0120 TaxID=3090670 RepID=UPI00298CCF33|nr:GntR family transcriptional regulator [Mesorhizobium sp. BAC0120]MDW6023298.1 GntR family transcriptional regulator [Mesorhizobium sp. BAC0120]